MCIKLECIAYFSLGIYQNKMMEIEISIPSMGEQKRIGEYFKYLDNLTTLHQHKSITKFGGNYAE